MPGSEQQPTTDPALPPEPLAPVTGRLLCDLAESGHPAAGQLREAWAVDLFLRRRGCPAEAARAAGVPLPELERWLEQRQLGYRLDVSPRPPPEFSVVVPVFNEEENIPEFYQRVTRALEPLGSFELVFVNDGSSDSSPALIRDRRERDSRVKLVELSRNFGHQAAITAGTDYSRGRAVIFMDADLQDPPEIFPEMVSRWRAGYQVIYAVRERRDESLAKRGIAFLFYRFLRTLANIEIPVDSGDFCLLDRAVVEQLKRLPERNRFLRGLRSWVGFRQTALPYERPARHAGVTKYSFPKMAKLALDGIISFSSLPLRLATYLGLLTCLGGLGYLAYALVQRVITGSVVPGWTSTVLLILLLGGAQLILLGVLGEYVARIYDESKQRPTYVVAEFLD